MEGLVELILIIIIILIIIFFGLHRVCVESMLSGGGKRG